MQKSYPVLGYSMRFALEPGDSALAEPCAPAALAPGDLALLVKWAGGRPAGYVIHRVLLNLNGRFVLTKGDACFLPDFPPSAFQPAARVSALERGEVRWPAGNGVLWPLAAAYCLAANKLLALAAYAAYFSLSGAALLLPRAFRHLTNAASLYWESRLHPALVRAASAPLRPAAAAAGQAAQVKSGRINSDEVWSGRVTVADYLTIAPGASVMVTPGTEIIFERSEPGFFPVIRAGSRGETRELDSALAKILVYGEFRAEGTPAGPVLLGGDSFGGIHALGGGRVLVRGCLLRGAGAAALTAWDHSFAEVSGTLFQSCLRGVELCGQAGASLENCAFLDQRSTAVRVLDEANLVFAGGPVSCGEGAAFEFSGRCRAYVRGADISGKGRGIHLSGKARAELRGVSARGCSGGGILAAEEAEFRARDCSLAACAFGLHASGSVKAYLDGCDLAESEGAGLRAEGRCRIRVSGCSLRGNRSGLSASGANSLSLRGSSLSAAGDIVRLRGRNSLDVEGCLAEGGFAGVDALGTNRLRLRDCVFRGQRGAMLRLERPASVLAQRCRFDSGALGVLLDGCPDFRGEGLVFSGTGGAGLRARESSSRLERCSFRSGQAGAEFGGGRVRLRDCSFEDHKEAAAEFFDGVRAAAAGCHVSGSGTGFKVYGGACLEAKACALREVGGAAAEASGGAELLLEDCSGAAQKSGVSASGRALLSMNRVSLTSVSGPALHLAGGASAAVSGSRLSSAAEAVYSSGEASLDASCCRFSSSGSAALKAGGGRARLRGCLLEGRAGAEVSLGAALDCTDTSINAAVSGVDSRGAFSARRVALNGGEAGGMRLAGPSNELVSVSVHGTPHPGIALAGGAAAVFRDVSFAGGRWAPKSAPRRRRRRLFHLVAATSGIFPFRPLYRAAYSAAVAAARALLGPAASAVYLYRGLTGAAWVAGLSDIDLACILPPETGRGNLAAHRRLARRLSLLRRAFPFIGEVLVCDARELAAFTGTWGTKAAEFRSGARLLAGAPAAGAAMPPQGGIADRTEAFYAYTLLMRHFLSDGEPERFIRRNCAKNLADILRYLSPAGLPGRLSRPEFAASAGVPLDDYMSLARGEYAYRAFTALHAASPESGAPVQPADIKAGWFNGPAFEASARRISERAGCAVSLVLDTLYRVYAVLPDEAAGDRGAYLAACAALLGERERSSALDASPLVLTQRAFAHLCSLPYLNNPFFAEDILTPAASAGPDEGGVFCRGPLCLPSVNAGARRGSVLAAAAHFGGSWRSLWGEMPPHYFYTRSAGLRLGLAGAACPGFSGPRALSKALERAGVPGPGWESFLAARASEVNYAAVEALLSDYGRTDAG